MAIFGGMFGGQKHPNLDRLAQAIRDNLGLQLAAPTDDVFRVIDVMTAHDLTGIENAHSIEGLQELLRVKSLRTVVDVPTQTVALFVAAPEEIERELKVEHSAVKVFSVNKHHTTSQIVKNFNPATETIKAALGPAAQSNTPAMSVPPAFEHLEATERFCPAIVDLLVKHGQLMTSDKDVLKKIKPIDYTLEARIVALERWQAEISRRLRGIHVARTGATSLLAGPNQPAQPSEAIVRQRFDMFLRWLSKLIKAFEGKDIKFHGKPVWLPY
jgi:hypothetical protein